MTMFRRLALISILPLVFAACSSGGADDDAVERTRDAEAAADAAADDTTHADEHGEHHDAASDDEADSDRAATDAKTIEVEMTEFAYDPSEITVPAGEPITFVFHNAGVIAHEAMVGDAHMQDEFASMDGHGDHGDGHHGDVNAVTVPPGETVELVVTFDEPGETMLGCHLEGHWEAGMAATVTVA